MRTFLFLFNVLFCQIAVAEDLLWLEREWISNVDMTIEANPGYLRLNPDAQAKFRGLFGKTRWRFTDGIFESQVEEGTKTSTPYFVRPIDTDTFEILISEGGSEVVFELSRHANGFCAKQVPTWVPGYNVWTEPVLLECFTPNGA